MGGQGTGCSPATPKGRPTPPFCAQKSLPGSPSNTGPWVPGKLILQACVGTPVGWRVGGGSHGQAGALPQVHPAASNPLGPGWDQGAPPCFQDNRATVAVGMEGAGRRVRTRKDIVAKPDDVIELQRDVPLVWDAHVIHERLWGGRRVLSQGTWGREPSSPPALLGARH